MKSKILLINLVSFIFALYLISCDSSSYEIEELEVQEDTSNTAQNSEIKQNIEHQKSEIKEETSITRKKPVKYTVQIGAFEIRSNAEEYLKKARGLFSYDFNYNVIEGLYKVRTGVFDTQDEAMPILEQMKEAGFLDAFITEANK
jgi:cell division protein FtsN